ncbi:MULTISPECIES: hypothetical protein [Sphingomonas]|jgi:hypothetical protein|uniref:Uncharacterized protein n=1 Tax=Sphingomonas turrisvirgatae TaxID=1888892 RepID=A0A1E3LYJ1_9SPHN|nr:hypothetical protein [Sphingomonas turrisvirgatae]ODP38783.1 hypothetical protein BFL28_13385 [Sphingomonas turrisvirgatae]
MNTETAKPLDEASRQFDAIVNNITMAFLSWPSDSSASLHAQSPKDSPRVRAHGGRDSSVFEGR